MLPLRIGVGAVIVVMLIMFVLGFVLDFIEITFVVVPIIGPVLILRTVVNWDMLGEPWASTARREGE